MSMQWRLSVLKRFAPRSRRGAKRRDMNPLRAWIIGLALALPVFAVGAAYAAYRFIDVQQSLEQPPEVSVETAQYREDLVERVVTNFEARRRTLEAAIGGPVFDPSAPPVTPTTTPVAEDGEGGVE